jgi:N4-gp56 family major capsid protein
MAASNSITTSGTLTYLMQIYYDKVFLDRAELMLVYDFGAQKKNVPLNNGVTVYFNRFSPLAVATTALSEANPSAVAMSATLVSATIAEYGNFTQVSTLFDLTSLDVNLKEHVEVMGQNAGETLDTLTAAVLSAGATTQLAGAKSNITAVAATDTLSGAEIRKAVRTLKANKAKPFDNGMYRGIVPVYAAYDLRGDSNWLAANTYTDVSLFKNGQIGRLHGVDMVETNNQVYEASTVNVYHTYVFGKNAYGTLNLAGQPNSRIIIKTGGPQDTSNPLDMYSTIGWKAYFVAKVLNADWVIAIHTGVTA